MVDWGGQEYTINIGDDDTWQQLRDACPGVFVYLGQWSQGGGGGVRQLITREEGNRDAVANDGACGICASERESPPPPPSLSQNQGRGDI
jgi:hypothetical protein